MGDDSGTHQRELSLWGDAGLDPYGAPWYLEVGVGMREAIAIAEDKDAYIISDRATFLYLKPKGLSLLLEDSDHLYNYYSIIAVNPKHFADVNYRGMHTFIQWLISSRGQKVIASYQDSGHQLFQPEQMFLYDDD